MAAPFIAVSPQRQRLSLQHIDLPAHAVAVRLRLRPYGDLRLASDRRLR